MVNWLRDTMLAHRAISPGDMDLFTITDDPAEAVRIILESRGRIGFTPATD
jgi:predicted Rossmann-fold nucleotide-binding protein